MSSEKPRGHHRHPPVDWDDIFSRLVKGKSVTIPKHNRFTILQTRDLFLRLAKVRGLSVDHMVALGHLDARLSWPDANRPEIVQADQETRINTGDSGARRET